VIFRLGLQWASVQLEASRTLSGSTILVDGAAQIEVASNKAVTVFDIVLVQDCLGDISRTIHSRAIHDFQYRNFLASFGIAKKPACGGARS
jgi:ribosomal protein S4E